MSRVVVRKAKKKVDLKGVILIEGLPGVGNVGKIAVDFMVESLEAKKLYEFRSSYFPNCVFVNERSLIGLPKMILYHKKIGRRDFVFLSGDVQPASEEGCYALANTVLSLFKDVGIQEVLTLGGLGLEEIPGQPKVYYAASNSKHLTSIKKKGLLPFAHHVGPVLGMSGVLAGMAKEEKINAGIYLVDTFGHPTYIGVKESRELLKVVNDRYRLRLNMKELDKEISVIEKELKGKIEQALAISHQDDKRIDSVDYMG